MGLEIRCPACGQDSFLRREPVYEGFRKTGERLSCAGCGHVFAGEAEVPFVGRPPPRVFDAAERPRRVDVFAADEKGRFCRYCVHYIVNPFTQRCGLHFRVVQATDACADFEAPPDRSGAGLKE